MDLLSALVRRPSAAHAPAPAGLKLYPPHVAYPWREASPASSNWDTERAIQYGYNASSWVYRCVTMTAELGMTLPLGEQVRNSDGEWVFDWATPISEVLSYFNDDMGPEEAKYHMFQYFDLSGNSLVGKRYASDLTSKASSRRRIAELRVESPALVEPFPDGAGGILRYEYPGPNGRRLEWLPEDICHGRLPDPANPYWGLSRLVALARTIDGDRKAQEWRSRILERGGVPAGFLFDQSIKTAGDRRKAQKEIDDTWAGRVGPFIAPGEGVSWVALGMPAKDVAFLEGRTFAMREIVITFGYHPALFGEDATYHNTGTAERSKWLGAVLPRQRFLCGMLTRGLIPREDRGKRRVWYDISEVEALRADETKKTEEFVKLVGSGVPIDTAAKKVGLDVKELPDKLGQIPLIDGRLLTLQSVVEGRTEKPL